MPVRAASLLLKNFAVQRALAAGCYFLSAVYLAKVLAPQRYGEIVFFMMLTKMLLMGGAGSAAGYLFSTFKNRQELTQDYLRFYMGHLFVVALAACWLGSLLGEVYLLSGIGFLLLIPYHAIEPLSRIEHKFYTSLLPDIVLHLSVVVTTTVLVMILPDSRANSTQIIAYSLVGVLALYVKFFSIIRPYGGFSKGGDLVSFRTGLRRYGQVLLLGAPAFWAGTVAFTSFLFIDRFFLEKFHSKTTLGLYMLAFQLATGAGLFVSSRNFVSQVEIGELMRQNAPTRAIFHSQLKRSVLIAIPSFVVLVVASCVLERFVLSQYLGLALTSSVLGLGLIVYQVVGAVAMIGFYYERQWVLVFSQYSIIILAVFHNIFVLWWGLNGRVLAFFSSAWLILYSLLSLMLCWRLVKQR